MLQGSSWYRGSESCFLWQRYSIRPWLHIVTQVVTSGMLNLLELWVSLLSRLWILWILFVGHVPLDPVVVQLVLLQNVVKHGPVLIQFCQLCFCQDNNSRFVLVYQMQELMQYDVPSHLMLTYAYMRVRLNQAKSATAQTLSCDL